MVIDEIRTALGVEHDIACLEITVHEAVSLLRDKVFRKEAEVGFKLQFVEIKFGRLEETVLKIIQVEQHGVLVKLGLRITIGPVQSARATYLYVRKLANSIDKQLLLTLVVASAGLASAAYRTEQRHTSKVFLQVTKLIVRHSKDVRHRKLALLEMPRKVNEGMVFVTACTYNAYDRTSISPQYTEIPAVAAGCIKLFHARRRRTAPRLI